MKNPERHKYANKANMAIAIVFKHKKESSTPKWEQFVAASGAATLLSTSLWAANWASHWVSMKDQNNKALRKFHNLKKREELLGWIFVGDWAKPEEQTKPKKRPSFDDYVSFM